jgi:diguanylate cyclase (GGDEF)-like protein
VIDIQTFLLALGIGNIGFAVLMAGYSRGAAANPALMLWMWARLGLGATQLLGWFRPGTALPLLQFLEPVGWIGFTALEMAAYCVFFGLRRWQRVLWPTASVALLLVLDARYRGASDAELTALVSIIVALFAATMGVILLRLRRRGATLLQTIIGINDAVFAVAMGVWAWTGVDAGHIESLRASPVQAFAFLAGYLLMIVNGFGFLLLCKQRDDAQMERLATIDFLTGLLNRRAFFERAETARLLAARLRKPIALLMLDIDHFKQINDRFGHATGDQALALFADIAREELRDHDIMGRLGGEEFALALPGTDLEGAQQAAERLRHAVEVAPLVSSGHGHCMSVSIGVALIDANEELSTALARADHALYAAKRGGRNRVETGEMELRRA